VLVAANARVGHAGEELVVAGVRAALLVRHAHRAAARGVAEELPVAHHLAPEKRHQRAAPGVEVVTPVALDEAGFVLDVVHERTLGAAEDFGRSQPVERDDDHVLLGRVGDQQRDDQQGVHHGAHRRGWTSCRSVPFRQSSRVVPVSTPPRDALRAESLLELRAG
jgi:hypothetical protein